MGRCGCVSSMVGVTGSPNVAHVDENTKRDTPAAAIAPSTLRAPVTLFR